ncbi:MAG: SDR family NAD(P)-dependent oxidoreductase, partial [Bdellovibrionaceae bacterium]|nr:SDR family NAD(P)-dependent oxidoreductase [Pseudobdellovibrionaceae bacterium]
KPEEVIRQFQVNAIGPLALTRELLPALRATRGRVLNLTSLAGITVFPFYGTYAATKYAMHALSEAMYYELKPFGIQVAAIEPGGYRTGLMRNARFGDSTHPHAALYSDRLRRFDGFLKHVQDHIEKDPEVVAQTLVSLTEKSRIRPRYLVGGEAVANGILRRLTPDRVFLPIQDWIYRKFFF